MGDPTLLILAGVFAAAVLIAWYGGEKGSYTYGHNPAVRYCDACDQQQFSYCCTMSEWENDWWSPNGEIKDPTCNCHKDTR